MNKKIIFTVTNDLTYDQRMSRVCTELEIEGFDVLLIGREKKNSKPLSLGGEYQQRRMKLFFETGKLFYIEYNLRLFFFLLFHPFAIVCGIDLDTIVPCILVSKLKGKPCVFDAHELFAETPEVERRKSIQKFWLRVESFSVRRITKGICVSDGLKEYFFQKYEKKFTVVRNVPDKGFPVPRRNEENANHASIIYQGALNEGRGLEQLVEAMKMVEAKLTLIGEGDLSAQLRMLVKNLHLENKIEFSGFIEPNKLRQLTRNFSIGINLLEARSKNYYHSLANKFFDYTEAGIPSLNMNFPEYKKLNSEFEVSVLLDDLKIETISSALNRLLKDKELYNRLHQNCLLARQEWDWDTEKERLLEVYDEFK